MSCLIDFTSIINFNNLWYYGVVIFLIATPSFNILAPATGLVSFLKKSWARVGVGGGTIKDPQSYNVRLYNQNQM